MKFGPFEIKFNFRNPKASTKELGETGTTFFGGYITDDDYVTELKGNAALVTYNKMRRSDGVVKAALLACELPIRAARWWVEPVSEDEKDKEVAEFVEKCLFENMSITWDDFLRQALLMLPFGFSVFEKVFQAVKFNNKEMIGWRKFAPRLQSTILKWKLDNGKDGVVQLLPTGKHIPIPMEKLLVFTHRKEGENWVGISVLRNAYRSWFFKNHIEKINAIAFERQGLGIPYGVLPKGYTKADRDKMEELLKNIRANEQGYMIIPDGWEVGFIDMKAKTAKDPSETIKRYNREILESVLAQFLELGAKNTGSRALSVDHSQIFHNNLTAVARQVKDVMNKYAIKQLVDLNYTVAEYPKLNFGKIGVVQYEKISKAISQLVQQRVLTPDEKLEDSMRILLDLPEKPEEEEGEKNKPKEEPKKKDIEEKKASEYISWRELTFAENKVDFNDIQKKMDKAEKELRIILKKVMSDSGNDLIRQMQKVLDTPDNKEKTELLNDMAVKYQGKYKHEIMVATKEMFTYGKMSAAKEMGKEPVKTPPSYTQNMRRNANNLRDVMANDLMKAGKLALLLALQQNKSKSETLNNITKAIRRQQKEVIYNVPTISVVGAVNQGRRAVFEGYKEDIYALQRSEILDSVTCNFCISIDKRVFKKGDQFTHNDGIHSHCRGLWVEILKAEKEKPEIGGIPKTLRDNFETINVFKPPKHPIIKKDSPAVELLKKRSAEIEEVEEAKKSLGEEAKSLLELREKINNVLKDDR